MLTGMYVVKNQKAMIPTEFLERVLKDHNAAYSVCFANDKTITLDKAAENTTVDDLNELQGILKDKTAIFFFGGGVNKFHNEDDIQPFILLNDKDNKPSMVAFLHGDFKGYEQVKSTHSSAFFAAQQVVVPTIQKFARLMGDNLTISNLMGELDADFGKTVENLSITPCSVSVLANTGEIKHFNNNEDAKRYPWGWASASCGYIEKSAETPKVEEPPKKVGLLERVKAGIGPKVVVNNDNTVEVVAPKSVSVPSVSPSPVEEPKTDTKVPLEPVEHVWVAPPPGMTDKGKKRFYRAFGYKDLSAIPNWRKGQPVKVLKDRAMLVARNKIDGFEPIITPVEGVLETKQQTPAPVTKVVEPPKQEVKTTPPTVTTPPKSEPPKAVPGYRAMSNNRIISADDKKHLNEMLESGMIKGMIDQHSQTLTTNPSEIQSIEKKYPQFSEYVRQLGGDISKVYSWPRAVWEQIASNGSHMLVDAIAELSFYSYQQSQLLDKATAPSNNKQETKPVQADRQAPEAKRRAFRM